MRKLICIVGSLLLAPLSVDAKVLYVDVASGNDSTTYAANGPSNPWRSIGRAAWGSTNRNAPNPAQAAQAGDTVIVRAGTYGAAGTDVRFDPVYNPVNSGRSGQQITFQAEGVVVLTLTSSRGPVIGANARDYITWRGFTINEANAPTHADTGSVVLWNTTGSTAENLLLDGNGNPGYGDNHPGIRIERSSQLTIRNNRISNYHTSVVNQANGAGIQVYFSGNLIFENNDIFNCGSGIFLKAPADGTTGTGYVGQFTIRYNLIYDTHVGIAVHRSPNTASAPTRIYQNIVKDSVYGVRIWTFDQGFTDPMNAKIVNNTFYNNQTGVFISGDLVNNAGHVFRNNIIRNSPTYAINYAGGTSNLAKSRMDFEHNLYSGFGRFAIVYTTELTFAGWKSTFGQDAAVPPSLNVDPLFLDAAGDDFRLQLASPARNAGRDYLDLDSDGSTTESITLGAYISGSEVIGRGSIRPPFNVRVIR